MLQVKDADFVGEKSLTISTSLDCCYYQIHGEYDSSSGFALASLVTIWGSLEEVCLPSFEVFNCWLNLVGGLLLGR